MLGWGREYARVGVSPSLEGARLCRALRGEGERRRARARRWAGVLAVAAVGRRALERLGTRRRATRWLQLAAIWPARVSGGGETGHLLVGVVSLWRAWLLGGEDKCHRLDLALDYATASRMAIARADQADDEATAEAAGFFQALGKTVSVVDDAPGLVVMRTVAMLANEAADVVHQGVADAVDVDVSMMKGVNYPRGPLAWADDVGPARISGVMRRSRARIRRGSLPELAVASPPSPIRVSFSQIELA